MTFEQWGKRRGSAVCAKAGTAWRFRTAEDPFIGEQERNRRS